MRAIRAKIIANRYIVTEDGQVFAMNYRNRQLVGRMRPYLDPNARCGGYYRVNINGRVRDVHRLVAEAFIPRPGPEYEVNHKDGNKLNNNVSNLEWVTHLANVQHAYRTGLITGAQIVLNARHPHPTRRTITADKAAQIKELLCEGLPDGIVAEIVGVPSGVVNCIKNNQTYKDVPWPDREKRFSHLNASAARWALHRYRKNKKENKKCKS